MNIFSKIPSYILPAFQQGGLVFRDNLYTQPINTDRLNNILATPASQGFGETMQVAQLQNQNRQLYNQERQIQSRMLNDSIENQLRQKDFELRKKQYEDLNLRYILKERAEYVDKLTGDDIDPIFADRVKILQDKHQLTADRPLTMEGLAEQQKAIQAYYTDPEYRNVKEYSTLIKHITEEADKVNSAVNKYKLESPEKYADYNLKDYEDKVGALRKNLIEIGDGDFTKDGILDAADMGVLKAGLAEVRKLNLELTDEAQERITKEREVKFATNEALLNKQKLANRGTDIDLKLAEQQMTALEEFIKVQDNPASTDEDLIKAKNKLAATNKKISEISNLSGGSTDYPKSQWDLAYRAGQGDEAALKAINLIQEDKVELKGTPTTSVNSFYYDTDGEGKKYKQKGSLRYYNGYTTDLNGGFKYGFYGESGMQINKTDLDIEKGTTVNGDGTLRLAISNNEVAELFGIDQAFLDFGQINDSVLEKKIPGAKKRDGVWYIKPKTDSTFGNDEGSSQPSPGVIQKTAPTSGAKPPPFIK